MGTSRSAAELVGKLHSVGEALTDNSIAMNKTALAVKQVFATARTSAGVNGTTRISRAVKERYDVKGTRNAVALVKYTGPAHLINNPTKAHSIVSRKNRGSRKSRSARADGVGTKGAVLVGGEPRAFARHPGTRGKHFFERARVTASRVAPEVYAREGIREPLRRIFR